MSQKKERDRINERVDKNLGGRDREKRESLGETTKRDIKKN